MEGEDECGGGVGVMEREGSKVEEAKRRGRPTKAEAWGRERTGSLGNIEDLLNRGKRKEREGEEEMEAREVEEIFKRSKKVERTPEKLGIGKAELEQMLRGLMEGMRKNIGEDLKKVGKGVEEGREEMLRQLSEMKESWERERAELRGKIEMLEKKVQRLELKEKKEEGGETGEEERRELSKKVRELVIRINKKEREGRRRNLIIKGVKVEGKGKEEVVEEIWGRIGVKEKVEEVRRIGKVDRKGRGLKNKEKDFWEGIKEWDVLVMCETWVGRREWEGIRNKATKGYVWELQYAVRRGKKGRAMGRMLIEAREGIKMMRVEREDEEEERIMARKIWLREEVWNMIGVYVNKDLQKKLERMREWMEEREKGVRVIVGGDLDYLIIRSDIRSDNPI
ncbi:uncharacterized protein LOC128879936 [Hylaeus volcanicus]|uniref:uncharacterized protein LOC128879936 n=1 Tax=Hylaeus volcanicus TaxID=313075 RepID=UPI0023B861A2|nr:uncharacterized protein LOC128879936 [Hylaeus volcanicus]